MPEPSKSLAVQFRAKPDPDLQSHAAKLVEEAAKEDYEFIAEVAMEVPFSAFLDRMTVQNFNRVRALAVSDLFEDVVEEVRAKLVPSMTLQDARSLPEYREICEMLRAAAKRIATEGGAKAWLERAAPRARRAMSRVFRAGNDPREAARAAAEVLDREIPKASRTQDDTRLVRFDEESARLMNETLEIHRKTLPSGS